MSSKESSHHSFFSARMDARVATFEANKREEDLARVRSLNSIEFLVDDPIACGYLRLFCESQFCVENVHFVVEVGRFKDIFSVDLDAWGKNRDYKTLDSDIGLHGLRTTGKDHRIDFKAKKIIWPSNLVNQEEVEARMKVIWDLFLSDDAHDQICVPAQIFVNTLKRLQLIHVYGPTVYDEALLDPLKTLKRDIFPRFIVSDIAQEMQRRQDSIETLPSAADLVVPPPPHATFSATVTTAMDLTDRLKEMSMAEVLRDRVLYERFLYYLKGIVSAENLLCVRMIEYFKELMPGGGGSGVLDGSTHSRGISGSQRITSPSMPVTSTTPNQAVQNQAWLIYLYFVHPGSAYEVGLSHRRRRELRLSMANPSKDAFDRLEKSAMDALKVHFMAYKQTSSFVSDITRHIEQFQMEERKRLELASKSKSKKSWWRLW